MSISNIILNIVNKTGTTKTYLSGVISVAGSGTTAVTNPDQQFNLAVDGQFRSDIMNALIQITDGVSTYGTTDAIDYVNLIASNFKRIKGGSDGTEIGNIGDRLKSQNLPAAYAPNIITTGSLAALNSTVSTSVLDGFGTAGVSISGTWVGTITFQATIDGTNWYNMIAQPIAGGILASTTTVNTAVRLNITGVQDVRVLMSNYTSGTANITIDCTAHAGFIRTLSNLAGGTDGTQIGNNGDRLKVDTTITGIITGSLGANNILKQNEIAISVKVETDLPSSTYTVPTGKSFSLTTFSGSYDVQQPMIIRFKKQTGGTGAFVTLFRETLSVNGQDATNFTIAIPNSLIIGSVGDVFKVTYEPAVGRGSLWAGYTGIEY